MRSRPEYVYIFIARVSRLTNVHMSAWLLRPWEPKNRQHVVCYIIIILELVCWSLLLLLLIVVVLFFFSSLVGSFACLLAYLMQFTWALFKSTRLFLYFTLFAQPLFSFHLSLYPSLDSCITSISVCT